MKLLFDELRIIGNGPGFADKQSALPSIAFNGSTIGCKSEIMIYNAKEATVETSMPFVIESELFTRAEIEKLELLMLRKAKELESLIACHPSVGLTTIFTFKSLVRKLSIEKLPLTPSFIRGSNLGERKPLPCNFHNWLGERRCALKLLRDDCDKRLLWRSIFIKKENDAYRFDRDPYHLLDLAFNKMDVFKILARVQVDDWLRYSSREKILNIEGYFYLNRHVDQTANWWLFDNKASEFVDRVFRRIAWCQQELFMKDAH